MTLPNYIKQIILLLEQSGYEAYAVGGCVRDFLLGRDVGDYDITTSATPDEVKEVFDNTDYRIHDTGLKHGTVTLADSDKNIAEITTFRIDGEYSDNRRPDSVTFTRSLREDLSRRDFTVNAMAYSDKTGIVDYFGGREDLESRVIRAVSDPYKRFNEDGLRILRAYRFSAVLGFRVELATAKAAYELHGLIHGISGERISQELNKTASAHFGRDKITSLAMLFRDVGWERDEVQRFMKRLKYDNDTFSKVMTLTEYKFLRVWNRKSEIKSELFRFGEEMFFRMADFSEWDRTVVETAKQIISDGECYSLKQLQVKGEDLVALGYEGKRVGDCLYKLLFAVIYEECANVKEELLSHIKKSNIK